MASRSRSRSARRDAPPAANGKAEEAAASTEESAPAAPADPSDVVDTEIKIAGLDTSGFLHSVEVLGMYFSQFGVCNKVELLKDEKDELSGAAFIGFSDPQGGDLPTPRGLSRRGLGAQAPR